MATDASSEAARMPDGSTYNLMSTKYPLRVCVQDYQHELYFAVCPLSTYDVILGKKWHEDYNVRNKYQTNSITFRENGRTRRINATLELPQNLWRKKQVVHHMQKENAVFAVLLRSREPQEPFELNAMRVNQDATDQDIQEILLEYADYFLKTFQKGLPSHRGRPLFKIELANAAEPHKKGIYRLSESESQELLRQIRDLISKGFIQPSTSPWAAPVLSSAKKDGGLR